MIDLGEKLKGIFGRRGGQATAEDAATTPFASPGTQPEAQVPSVGSAAAGVESRVEKTEPTTLGSSVSAEADATAARIANITSPVPGVGAMPSNETPTVTKTPPTPDQQVA